MVFVVGGRRRPVCAQVTLDGQAIKGSPFPLLVAPKPKPTVRHPWNLAAMHACELMT